jgi:hypothetical protein
VGDAASRCVLHRRDARAVLRSATSRRAFRSSQCEPPGAVSRSEPVGLFGDMVDGAHDSEARNGSVDGRHLLVVGAGHGLGEAVARRFAEGGYRVTLLARSADRLGELADGLADTGSDQLTKTQLGTNAPTCYRYAPEGNESKYGDNATCDNTLTITWDNRNPPQTGQWLKADNPPSAPATSHRSSGATTPSAA